MAEAKSLNILLVEDNPGDILLAREALAAAGTPHRLKVIGDGHEAIQVLVAQREGFDLVILDLNLPRKNGREVMAELAQWEDTRKIPVAILTSSTTDGEICQEFVQLRTTYFPKCHSFRELVETMRQIERFARSAMAG